jgi:hypothetical protein
MQSFRLVKRILKVLRSDSMSNLSICEGDETTERREGNVMLTQKSKIRVQIRSMHLF